VIVAVAQIMRIVSMKTGIEKSKKEGIVISLLNFFMEGKR